ncbi:unnamed protein product [Paramecium sonneborni]|uniref:Uncharacterized protein n=1 Tax=Paramecium sonneborni TaxID=65129 RepID=A0A8S1PQN0_9CILI|nr:unnamed protein product [Paramecium sonneborni]
MNLTPKSQAIFQSFFLCRTKEHFSNSLQDKSSLSNRQACNKFKQIFDKPSRTKIQQIGNFDNIQAGCDGLRKITLDESQLTVVGIRKTSRISQVFEQILLVPQLSQHQQRKAHWIQTPEKHLSLVTQMNSPDQEKESKLIRRIKEQQSIKDNKCPKIKMNVLNKKLLNQNGADEYFKDMLFHQRKIIPAQSDKIRIIIRREEKTIESQESKKKENLRNYH